MKHLTSSTVSAVLKTLLAVTTLGAALLATTPAAAEKDARSPAPGATETQNQNKEPSTKAFRLGAHAELDVGTLIALRQSAAFGGGVVYGPFRAGMSYATFLSNAAFGGVPERFSLRVNHLIGINASYFIAQTTDEGFYIQAMLHVKQHGVTNLDNGAHRNLNSVATGLELGYLWKVYRGLYVAPRVGALYYVKKPQGPGNHPVNIGGRAYDNKRHHDFDTYYIPTLSVGYSW